MHDAVMNEVWKHNTELGGKYWNYKFEFNGKTWHTDGLLENVGGFFTLEVAAANYDERIVDQLQAYSTQIGHRDIREVIVVVIDEDCLRGIRREVAERSLSLGNVLITALRSKGEKLRFESLLLRGKPASYHHNQTAS